MSDVAFTRTAFSARPLAELAAGLVSAPADVTVDDVALDSRDVRPGALFLACRGLTHHGLEFAAQAIERGARAVLYEEPTDVPAPRSDEKVFVAGVPQLGKHAGTIADRFFGSPSQSLAVAGITGTNGKTTCAWLLAQALGRCGRRAAVCGTLGTGFPDSLEPWGHTTADVVTVHRRLATLRDQGADCVAMEVTSHALDQGRVDAVRFHTAAFTNLTRDHLDYHGSMESYGAAKAALFDRPTLRFRVVNVDDPFGAGLAARPAPGEPVVVTRKTEPSGSARFVRARRVELAEKGLEIDAESSWGTLSVRSPLIGEFNADNVLLVLAVLLAWGIEPADAARALATCTAPPGRMETFGGGALPLAVVDYAHTPDALEKALRAARGHCRGRLRVVFGCGGDRDAGKRPQMGRIASELADEVVVTDDNPRTEDPRRIVADILAGIEKRDAVRVEHDRAAAIRNALRASRAGDVVLVAGKGHEDYQIYGTERRAFSDRSVVRAELAEVSA
ncbi:MAG: UDP-N-acetylmuramoyl-L-alanyl-D-glutamate--2,6-diaminopimelate ligase [Pseudomonadota bacterium]|jgi:UDP-N-acetylmuramyl-tripeptide synthetase|nr:MAG: UDP-N-acetylmuramoyl-L-alanyl-D-glutamate--2,6-diaminopimelate ligase [Pseudomonadota bacterium]